MPAAKIARRKSAPVPAASSGRVLAARDPYRLGLDYAAQGQWRDAASAYDVAVSRTPNDTVLWLNLAHARLRLDDLCGGAAAAARAVALDPKSKLGLTLAAACLERAGRQRDLVELFLSVDMTAIDDAGLHLQMGMALYRLGRYQEAVKALLGVLKYDPRSAVAFAQLGNVFQLLKMPDEARESFRNALALGRAPVEMSTAVVFASFEASSWATIGADLAKLNELVEQGHGQPVPFFCLALAWTRQRQLAAFASHAAGLFRGIVPLPPPAKPRNDGPIRIGYVSSDFHEHATAYLIADLFESHDRERFEIYAYSYGDDDGSPMRRRIEAAFGGRFVEARQMPTRQLAERIRSDDIDVLIDLKGYTLYSRNDVFGYRAAPIQVNFLGFPGSLGTPLYDYIIGDPIVTPLEHADGFAEKIAQLPRCYQPNDRRRPLSAPAERSRCGLPQDAFVFCCFNANYKITPEIFDRWCALLHQIDDAVLWLYVTNPRARANLLAEAHQRGIGAERLFWATGLPLAEHLARMQAADLFLDTMPVNAHTTASDALWAGLPVLTVLGDAFVSRVAASLLGATGLSELVARDAPEYQRLALELARDRPRLRRLRAALVAQRHSCALFDSVAYARDFEQLIVRMQERRALGLAPDHLPALAASQAPPRDR